MKLTIWNGFKLGAWLITAFLIALMVVVYLIDLIDRKDPAMSIMFYFNTILLLILIWIILYLCKFLFNKLSTLNKKN